MPLFRSGRYKARFADGEADIVACQQLRYLAFIGERGLARKGGTALDQDAYDFTCHHVMVEEVKTDKLVCCFRMMALDGPQISQSYSAQFYELSKLENYPGRMVEMGRFCIHPAYQDPNILRTAWAAMSRFVDEQDVALLFGCSSFHGVEAEAYMDAFALLKERHLAPRRWLPQVKAPDVFRFARNLKLTRPDKKLALRCMPPLLRSYLVMGGWVSDHAVIDRELNTLHVFTGVEVKRVPKTRARLLRRA